MTRPLVLAWLFTAAASLIGCAHAESHAALFREPLEPVPNVELVLEGTPVTRPYTELGLVQAFGFGDASATEEVVRELRAKAGSLGCDGVIRARIDVGYSRSHGAGVCVRWDVAPVPGPERPTVPMSTRP